MCKCNRLNEVIRHNLRTNLLHFVCERSRVTRHVTTLARLAQVSLIPYNTRVTWCIRFRRFIYNFIIHNFGSRRTPDYKSEPRPTSTLK